MSRATPTLRELLDVAMDAAYLAGRRTLAHFNTGVVPDIKADDTPVTIADREAEQVLRARIARDFPEHAILGEEEGETAGSAPYRWILDPIDGTKSFVAGVPLYGVLVGVEVEGAPKVGVIYLPGVGDMVAAADGLGCTWNGRPCRVSDKRHLYDATVVTSSILRCQARSDAFDRLATRTRLQRTWGDAFGYALVATGRAEVMLDPAISVWDCAPMLPILREAGGFFGDWHGNPTIHGPDAWGVNGHLYEEVLAILRAENRRPEAAG
jgi:histidinol phosphatase-like enzyme (inositol monophosphatase family)